MTKEASRRVIFQSESERDRERDKALDSMVGKQIAAAWVTRHERDNNAGLHDVLHLRLTDGSVVDLASSDAEGYSSWLELA